MSKILIEKGDITKLACDCIVNAANKTLLGGGGVDGAIHRAAGPQLLDECKTLNGCKTGEAKITKGYNLKAKYIIHTVGPIYSGAENDREMLASCYEKSLELGKKHNIKSIAFPAISTGIYGYPKEEAAKIALETIYKWIDSSNYEIDIILMCFDSETQNIYEKYIKKENN